MAGDLDPPADAGTEETTVEAEAPAVVEGAHSRVAPLIETLVARIIAGGGRDDLDGAGPVVSFLAEPFAGPALERWFGPDMLARLRTDKAALMAAIDRDIAVIDGLLNGQVNAILHASRFQRLEASWRGLSYLVDRAEAIDAIKVKVLSISWSDVCRDLSRAIEFDQSQLFQKIYEQEFGMPGGEPYGIIVCDYEVQHRRTPSHPTDDVAALKGLSQIAAAAFSPMILAASPVLLGLDAFSELEAPIDLDRTFQSPDYVRWKALQDSEDARFIGLVVPRVLMRLPYRDDSVRKDRFPFREDVSDPSGKDYLWGSAAYPFASVVMRAYGNYGWFADIRGAPRDSKVGGLVDDLPVDDFLTDRPGIAIKHSAEVMISDKQEKELADLGLIALCHAPNTPFAVFYANPSLQRPKQFDRIAATINARLSAMLQYMFCVSRFAHFLKVIGRDRVGSFASADDVQHFLQRWIMQYAAEGDTLSLENRARFPLREAQIGVHEVPGKPGVYACTVFLRPHFQLDQLSAGFRLVTQINPEARAA